MAIVNDVTLRFMEAVAYLQKSGRVGAISDLAKKLGVSTSLMTEIGKERSNAGVTPIQNIVRVFGISATWLLTGQGDMLRDEQSIQPAEPTIIYKSDPKDAEIIELQRFKIKELEAKLHDRSVGLHSAPAADTPSVGGCQTSRE